MTIIGDAYVAVRPETSGFAEDAKSKIGDALKNPLVVAGAAVAAVTGVVEEFSRRSVDKFKEVGGEVKQLTLLTGGSAESMSRLRFAAEETGVSTDSLGAGLRILSKNVEANNDTVKKSGIAFHDARGNMLPMDTMLANVADKFAKMPNGVEKNTLAMKLFGRGGTDLIPILNKGRDGLAELGKQADKFGLTLTQNNLDAIKKNVMAHREWHAALEGLQVQFGSKLLPVINEMVELVESNLIPIIIKVTDWTRDNVGPVFEKAWGRAKGALEVLVDYIKDHVVKWVLDIWRDHKAEFETAWENIKTAFFNARDVIRDHLLPKLVDLYNYIHDNVLPAAEELARRFNSDLSPSMKTLSAVSVAGLLVSLGDLSAAFKELGVFAAIGGGGSKLATSLLGKEKWEGLSKSVVGFGAKLGPIAIVIAAVAAVGLLAYTHFKPFHDLVNRLAQDISTKAIAAFKDFHAWMAKMAPQIKEAGGHIQKAIEDILKVIRELWSKYGKYYLQIIRTVWNEISTVVKTVVRVIRDIIMIFVHLINGDWKKAWHDLVDILKAVGGLIWTTIKNIFKIIGDILEIAWKAIKEIAKKGIHLVWEVIKNGFEDTLKFIGSLPERLAYLAGAMLGELVRGVINGAIALWNFWRELPGKIFNFITGLPDTLHKSGHSAVTGMKNGIVVAAEDVWKWFRELPGKLWDFVKGANTWLIDAGGKIIDGILQGIDRAAHLVKEKLHDMAQSAIKGFMDAIKPGSPSRVFTALAATIPQGIAKGIEDNQHLVHRAMGTMRDALGLGDTGGIALSTKMSGVGGSLRIDLNVNAPGATPDTVQALRSVARTEVAGALKQALVGARAGTGTI